MVDIRVEPPVVDRVLVVYKVWVKVQRQHLHWRHKHKKVLHTN